MDVTEAILKLANAVPGAVPMNRHEGPWIHRVDDTWIIAVNGHREKCSVTPDGTMGADLEPFNVAVWYNGWLAGLFDFAQGGVFAAGDGANESTFCEAVNAAVEQLAEDAAHEKEAK